MGYQRYRIPIQPAPNVAPHPNRFKVTVNRPRLAELLLRELVHFRGDLDLVLSRPCVYGVFSGPFGGFLPRQGLCVGCLRCTIEYPRVVQILPNPERLRLGDSYFGSDQVDTVIYEAATGRVPVRGAGYGGRFGGDGWDSMWTDMSEIVRPTRDGIHGREYISTSVDIGETPGFLQFDQDGTLPAAPTGWFSLPIPVLFDLPPAAHTDRLAPALIRAAESLGTLVVLPIELAVVSGSASVVPLVAADRLDLLARLQAAPRLIELAGWDREAHQVIAQRFPESVIAVRAGLGLDLMPAIRAGVSTFHLLADYHGQTQGSFVMQAIRSTHEQLVVEGMRERITLLGSGGIVAAEHLPKAIISGLDAVALDTALLIALQAEFQGEVVAPDTAQLRLPDFEVGWGAQRLVNLVGSWRDQLLEILGAMGLREVRRLRGEIGRAMFQEELEREAFAGIERVA